MQFGNFRGGEKMICLREGFMKTAGAEVVSAAFEHCIGEIHRQHFFEDRQILLDELLLEIDRVGGDDRFFSIRDGEQHTRDQIAEALADSSSGFDEEVFPILNSTGDRHRHCLLLRPEFEVGTAGENPFLGKDMLNLGEEASNGSVLDGTDH